MKPVAFRSFAFALATLSLTSGLSAAVAKPTVEVAFVLDTTGSMGGLIEGAKRKIWSIATAIVDSNPDADIRMGLVAYRDIGDDYVTRTFDLTTDIQDLYANLLELRARGGGDWPESVNEALDVTVNKLHWTPSGDVKRIVFLVGDAPPHMDYAQDTKYPVTRSRRTSSSTRYSPAMPATPSGYGATSPRTAMAASFRSRRTADKSSLSRRPTMMTSSSCRRKSTAR
jgi:hypothetical protein